MPRMRALELSSPPYLLLLTFVREAGHSYRGWSPGHPTTCRSRSITTSCGRGCWWGGRFAELNRKLLDTQSELRSRR